MDARPEGKLDFLISDLNNLQRFRGNSNKKILNEIKLGAHGTQVENTFFGAEMFDLRFDRPLKSLAILISKKWI